ncbi:MAG: transcriptional repressor [Cyclobacteriaceae bacterium]
MTDFRHLKSILKSHGLRVTDCRLDVMQLFLDHKKALSQGDLENQFQQHDRVTLYRTLNSFLDSGIIHKIPNSSGVATYGLCHETCSPDQHDHNHMHFKCENCGMLECMDQSIDTSPVNLPETYSMKGIDIIISGLCAECND